MARVVQSHKLGEALQTLTKRVDAWKGERAALAVHLRELVGSAHALLSDLGHAAGTPARVRRGGRPKGYTMSAETRAKLRAAWARRKAVAAAEGRSPVSVSASGRRKKKRTMSAEARARISAAQKARWAKARKA